MAAWGTIFACVGHGLIQHCLRALAGYELGGNVIYEVCAAAAGEWKKSVDRAEERQVIEQMLAKSRDEIKAEVAQQIAELKKHATPEQAQQLADPKVAQGLELYLETIPDNVRARSRRPEDPSGNSVPANFSLREERGFVAILPNRSPRFRTGNKVGNYVLTQPLGMGGFGEVWKAQHVNLDSRVAAIKFCLDKDSKRNLLHEKKLIDRAQSLGRQPGIVELWDAFLDHNPPCLIYQFIEGGDLTGLMRTLKTLPTKERETRAVEVMIALTGIIKPLHAMVPPIIHRDLKPANILILRTNGQDSFWVTDFGIGALAADSALAGHRHGMSRGDLMSQSLRGTHTPMYASPEQVNHAVPDPRDDVHALAVIAYQLLIGDSTEKPGTDLEDVLKDLGFNGLLIQVLKDALRTKREDRLPHAGIFKNWLLEINLARPNEQRAEKHTIEKLKFSRREAKHHNSSRVKTVQNVSVPEEQYWELRWGNECFRFLFYCGMVPFPMAITGFGPLIPLLWLVAVVAFLRSYGKVYRLVSGSGVAQPQAYVETSLISTKTLLFLIAGTGISLVMVAIMMKEPYETQVSGLVMVFLWPIAVACLFFSYGKLYIRH